MQIHMLVAAGNSFVSILTGLGSPLAAVLSPVAIATVGVHLAMQARGANDIELDGVNDDSRLIQQDPIKTKERPLERALSDLTALKEEQKHFEQQKEDALKELKKRHPGKKQLEKATKKDEAYQTAVENLARLATEIKKLETDLEWKRWEIQTTANRLSEEFNNPALRNLDLAKSYLDSSQQLLMAVNYYQPENAASRKNLEKEIRRATDYIELMDTTAEDELCEEPDSAREKAIRETSPRLTAKEKLKLKQSIANIEIGYFTISKKSKTTSTVTYAFLERAIDNMKNLPPERDHFVREALIKTANAKGLKSLLEDDTFRICILPTKIINTFSPSGGTINGMFEHTLNAVFLAEHLFIDLKNDTALVYILGDEIAAAMMRRVNVERLIPTYFEQPKLTDRPELQLPGALKKLQGQLTLPWSNEQEYQEMRAAFSLFESNVENFIRIRQIPPEKRNSKDNADFAKYSRAMRFHQPRRYNEKGRTMLQNEFGDDIEAQIPKTLAKRIKRNTQAFIKEHQKFYKDEQAADRTYGNLDEKKALAEKITEFATLHQEVQDAFGKEVCVKMTASQGVENWCSRAEDDGYGVWPPGERPCP